MLGCDISFQGEVALVAFAAAQDPSVFPILMTVVAGLSAGARNPRMFRLVPRWYRRGLKATDMLTVAWEDLWELPLTEVREQLGIEPASDPLISIPG